MRERTSMRAFMQGVRAHRTELLEAARGLPALLTALLRREHGAAAETSQREIAELRAELAAAGRRRDALTLGAVLLLGGALWLGAGAAHAWLGWTLLAAGLVRFASGLRRSP